jgi:hypothetical protein
MILNVLWHGTWLCLLVSVGLTLWSLFCRPGMKRFNGMTYFEIAKAKNVYAACEVVSARRLNLFVKATIVSALIFFVNSDVPWPHQLSPACGWKMYSVWRNRDRVGGVVTGRVCGSSVVGLGLATGLCIGSGVLTGAASNVVVTATTDKSVGCGSPSKSCTKFICPAIVGGIGGGIANIPAKAGAAVLAKSSGNVIGNLPVCG